MRRRKKKRTTFGNGFFLFFFNCYIFLLIFFLKKINNCLHLLLNACNHSLDLSQQKKHHISLVNSQRGLKWCVLIPLSVQLVKSWVEGSRWQMEPSTKVFQVIPPKIYTKIVFILLSVPSNVLLPPSHFMWVSLTRHKV